MANSPAQTDRSPFQQLQAVVDLLETPALARLYAYALENGPVTVADIVDDQNVPRGTAYDYVEKLETAGFIEKTRDRRPYKFDAEPISLALSADGESQTIASALITAVARRKEDGDIDVYINKYGIDGLTVAIEYAFGYLEGTVNYRIAAREPDLSPLEAEIILQALEPVAEAYEPATE